MLKKHHNTQQVQLHPLNDNDSETINSVASNPVNVINYNTIFKSFSHEKMWNKWRNTNHTKKHQELDIQEPEQNEQNKQEFEQNFDPKFEQKSNENELEESPKQFIGSKKYVRIPNFNRLSFVNWLNKVVDDDGTRTNDVCNKFIKQHLKYIKNQTDINLYETDFQFINNFKYFLYINSSAKKK